MVKVAVLRGADVGYLQQGYLQQGSLSLELVMTVLTTLKRTMIILYNFFFECIHSIQLN